MRKSITVELDVMEQNVVLRALKLARLQTLRNMRKAKHQSTYAAEAADYHMLAEKIAGKTLDA